MLLQPYLDRITYPGSTAPTTDVLAALLAHHVQSVPFENLDVQLGRRLTTDAAAAYDKIVRNNRGGWCYEQNGLFGGVLAEIGFEVTRVAAAVMRVDRGELAEANHLCLLVRTTDSDETLLVDVGFGGSMMIPIPLLASEHVQAPFRIGLRKTEDDHWRFWEDVGGGEFSFDFLPVPADENSLTKKSDFLQTDPSSGFVRNLVTQIRMRDTHKTLRGKVFSIASGGGVETRMLDSADELLATLKNEFALDVPGIAELWPRIEARHDELMRKKALTDTYEIRSRANHKPLS